MAMRHMMLHSRSVLLFNFEVTLMFKRALVLCSLAFPLVGNSATEGSSEKVVVKGVRIGLPSDVLEDDKGGIKASIGYTQLELDYRRKFNYFFSLGISLDFFSDSEEKDSAREVDNLPNNFSPAEEGAYSGIFAAGGLAFNLNRFDNIILFAGPAISFGDTLVKGTDNLYYKVSDNRFGLTGGVVFAMQEFFVAAEYSTLTESPAITISFDLKK